MVRRVLAACLLSFALSLTVCELKAEDSPLMPPTADQDPRIQALSIQVAGHKRLVHYRTWGNPTDPAVLILHGSLSDSRGYQALSALAPDGYYVILWDQRGNGLSERITQEEYTEASIVEEIDAIAEVFSPGRPVRLVGHSFGGMYAALYLSERPHRVSHAVFLEPGGLNGDIFTKTYSKIINVDLFDPKLNSLFWQSEQIAPQDHETADYRALMILQNGRQANYHRDPRNPTPWPVWRPGGWVDVWRQHLLGYNPLKNSFHFDFARGASNFPHPVLFMGGTYSALGATYQAEYHAPLFPNGVSVVEIRGTGHRLVVEDPEGVLQAIREYFREYK